MVGVDGLPVSYTVLAWAWPRPVADALARVPDGRWDCRMAEDGAGVNWPGTVAEADSTGLIVGHDPRVAGLLPRSVSWSCAWQASCPVLVISPVMAVRDVDCGDRGGTRMTTAPIRPVAGSSRLSLRTFPSRPAVIGRKGRMSFHGCPRLGGRRVGNHVMRECGTGFDMATLA